MTTRYRVTFADGKRATMMDMEERGFAYAQVSLNGRFGANRIANVREIQDEPTSATRAEDDAEAARPHAGQGRA